MTQVGRPKIFTLHIILHLLGNHRETDRHCLIIVLTKPVRVGHVADVLAFVLVLHFLTTFSDL